MWWGGDEWSGLALKEKPTRFFTGQTFKKKYIYIFPRSRSRYAR